MTHSVRIRFAQLAGRPFQALRALSDAVHEGSLDARLIGLVQLRVSQIKGCGFCIDMHWRELVALDVAPRELNAVAGWREAPFFSERERAALRWAEIVSAIPQREVTDEELARLRAHFSDAEIAEVGFAIATITAWNLLNVSFRNPVPERT